MSPIVNYEGKNLYLRAAKYLNNDRLCLQLVLENGDLWDDLTINLPDLELEENTIFINSNIPTDLKGKLFETGVFINMFSTQQYNMGRYDVAYVNMSLLKEYLNYYEIEIWETEEDRDQGYGFIYDESFNDLDDAIKEAKKLYKKNNYASIEVLNNNNEVFFFKDNETEEYFFNNDKVVKVDAVVVDKYINNWIDKKELPIKERKIYCEMIVGGYLAVDNSNDECYVEEFETEKEAQMWLFGKEKENEVINEI